MAYKKGSDRPTVRRRDKSERPSKNPVAETKGDQSTRGSDKSDQRKPWRDPKAEHRPSRGRSDRDKRYDRNDRRPARIKPQAAYAAAQDEKWMRVARSTTGPGGYLRYGDIPAHKLGRALRIQLHELCKTIDEQERDNLIARIKQAATTVTASLAAGFGEGVADGGVQRALASRGALVVIQDHLDQLQDQEMLAEDAREALRKEIDAVIVAVNEYMNILTKMRP